MQKEISELQQHPEFTHKIDQLFNEFQQHKEIQFDLFLKFTQPKQF